jgi:TolB-like protein/Flp pilus assembly protein TadD
VADIFISYSNFDKEKASKLSQRLRQSGFSVWIDETNISAASQWSTEIVRAIEECKVFLILLSVHSFGSHNVIKELSLASEEKKHIIPVELEHVELTHDVKYQLAGIQRVPYKEYDKIEAALNRFISLETPQQAVIGKVPKKRKLLKPIIVAVALLLAVGGYFILSGKHDPMLESIHAEEIKRIVVLPFESLSSNKEDEFFADGLTAQVITTLSGLGGFVITDRNTAMHYKGRKSDLTVVAKELGVRYIVDGTVQKQDKVVKINSQLIDAQTGKVILSNQFEGSLDDLFGIQEKLARAIAFELQGSLANQNGLDTMLIRQGTKNPEAYNNFVLGMGYLENPGSQAQALKGLSYIEEALKIDPKFAYAQCVHALYYIFKFQYTNGYDPRDLIIGDSLSKLTIALDPTIVEAHFARASVARYLGETDTALHEAQIILRLHPDNFGAQSFIGSLYYEKGSFDLAAEHLEKAVQKNITDLTSWSLLIDSYGALGDTVKRNRYIDESLPLYDLYLEKNPADAGTRTHYALSLANRNLKDRSHSQIAQILKSEKINPVAYYNIACAYSILNEPKPAIAMLRKSFESGYNPGESISTDPDFRNLHNNSEFKELAKLASQRPKAVGSKTN